MRQQVVEEWGRKGGHRGRIDRGAGVDRESTARGQSCNADESEQTDPRADRFSRSDRLAAEVAKRSGVGVAAGLGFVRLESF